MSTNTVISVENLSKMYRLGRVNSGSFGHDVKRWWASIRGKEDPFSLVASENDRTQKVTENEYVWALKDVSFEVEKGEVLGIVGRNGAGKSTLLKLLTRVTLPTTGSIKAKGRIASLLEVGTGFHPDLTGRENIFLNGAILGMSKAEIKKKFDEIVDFSGVERYIDTPVKRYSSGMYVRLAFGVAAHLESEILIIDEVLAVGDTEFQEKCLGKMNDVSKNEGRTVIFVSHNIPSVIQLCSKTMYMEKGKLLEIGNSEDIIQKYVYNKASLQYLCNDNKNIEAYFRKVNVVNFSNEEKSSFYFDENIFLQFVVQLPTALASFQIGLALIDKFKRKVFTHHFNVKNIFNKNSIELTCQLPKNIIAPGNYSFDVALFIENANLYEYINDICAICIIDNGTIMSHNSSDYGCIVVHCDWLLN